MAIADFVPDKVVIDYDDLMKIPYFRAQIKDLTNESVILSFGVLSMFSARSCAFFWTESSGDVATKMYTYQEFYQKFLAVSITFSGSRLRQKGFSCEEPWGPTTFGYGRKHELRDKEKAHELYLHAKSEVESCIAYLKERRKGDPYRNLFPRLFYQATHGFTTEVPTFDL
ncbi:Acyltransferase-like protein, chloroplastic [Vitis vinifera]|uniref:Acyltransferase-like protein, chloroplastic n=1 Tax=Vitis vinifera TaxID=29760 RepID=A0A438JCU1_VITVI|nr:Acyltransferase-like protein, chloroplastic [Vitis vinifera]